MFDVKNNICFLSPYLQNERKDHKKKLFLYNQLIRYFLNEILNMKSFFIFLQLYFFFLSNIKTFSKTENFSIFERLNNKMSRILFECINKNRLCLNECNMNEG